MILLYNTNATRNPNAYLTLAVEAALRAVVGADGVLRVDERTLAREAATGAHALLLCIDGQRLNDGLIARVKPGFRRVVLWAFEDPFMLDYNLAHAALFDLVFTNDPSCVAAYGDRGHYLPLAASRMLHHRDVLPDPKLRHDIFFAGTMWPNRIATLRRVIAAFPDASMKLVCPTNEYLPPLPPQIASRAITRPISHEAFIDFANVSRVTLTLFRDYASHGASGLATAPGPRLFELGLAGTAQVVQQPAVLPAAQFAAIDGILLERGEALLDRIGDVLADTGMRASLARSAQLAVLAAHGYEHRLRRLLELSLGAVAPPPVRTTIRTNARTEARTNAGTRRLRVLMCTHSTMHNRVWGGVEVYQQMLCSQLEREVEVLFWIRGDDGCRLLDARGAVLERFDGEAISWLDVLCDPFEEAHFSDVLTSYDVDVVHFQHLGHHAASLPLIARATGVGTLLSVHDFFLVCSRYTLLDHEQKFCDIGARPISACTICLARAEGLPAGAQQQRRGFMEQVLGAIDLLLFGSRQSEELVTRIYPRTRVIRRLVMGVPAPAGPLPQAADAVPRRRRTDLDVLDVVVVGNFLRIKGADTVLQVIEAAPPHLFRFHILGSAEPHYHQVLQTLGARVTYHGGYAPGEAPLSQLGGQVALHLSIWPETWCISLSEVWQAGLIPIVTDIGALGERVNHGVDGFKVRVGDASAVLDLLEVLRANTGLRETLRGGIGPHLWADADAYAARILDEYRALAPKTRLATARPLGLDVGQLHLLATRHWKEIAAPRNILELQAGAGPKLDLPPSITGWASIQRCRAYVDAICGEETDPLAHGDAGEAAGFEPAERFSIKGWVFQPGASQAGQVFVCLIHRSGRHVVFLDAGRQPRADVQAIHPEAPLRSGYAAEVRLAGRWADGEYGVGVIVVTGGLAAFQLCRHQLWFLDGRVVRLAAAATDPASVLRAFACVFSCSPLVERFIAARAGARRRERAAPEAVRGPSLDRVEKRRAEGSGGRPLQE